MHTPERPSLEGATSSAAIIYMSPSKVMGILLIKSPSKVIYRRLESAYCYVVCGSLDLVTAIHAAVARRPHDDDSVPGDWRARRFSLLETMIKWCGTRSTDRLKLVSDRPYGLACAHPSWRLLILRVLV